MRALILTLAPLALVGTGNAQTVCGPDGCYVSGSYYWDSYKMAWVQQQPIYVPAQIPQPMPERKPEVAAKAQPKKADAPLPPTGVQARFLHQNQPSYQDKDGEINKRKAYSLVENTFDDDSAKRRITIIGSVEDRKRALAQLPADVDKFFVVTAFDPDHWYVADNGFVKTGTPTVYCQLPGGEVIHRQDDAADVGKAVQRARPDYDPKKDPDLRKTPEPAPDDPDAPAGPWVCPIPKPWSYVLAGVLLLFIRPILSRLSAAGAAVLARLRAPSSTDKKLDELIELLRPKDRG